MGLCTRCRKVESETGTKACKECREREKRYEQARQERVEASGLCKRCEENPRIEGRVWCGGCSSYMQAAKAKNRAKPKPAGTCNITDCRNPADGGLKSCSACRDRIREYERANRTEVQWRARQTRRRRRVAVFEVYGGTVCSCCGEDNYEFLTIDHVNGDGAHHRRSFTGTKDIYTWLKQNNFPPGFRVLCMNCNFALGYHGYCPHRGWTQATRNGRLGRPSKVSS